MSDTVPRRPFSELLRSPLAMWAAIAVCAAALWWKIDALEHEVLTERHAHEGAHDSDAQRSHEHPPVAREPSRDSRNSGQDVPHPHGPFHAATHPPEGRLSLVPEWEPAEAIAAALPNSRTEDVGYLSLLGDLADICLRRSAADWIVVVEQNGVAARAKFDALARQRKLPAERIRFFEVKSLDSIWIRDYGPIFLRRQKDRQLFVVDLGYRDVRLAGETGSADIDPPLRPSDDLVPVWLSTILRRPFVHPGLVMNGGDLYADGQGVLYTSEETLHLNTGDQDYVAGLFRQFFGVREARYLRSLPGPSVKHVDMIFKLASPNTCLVGRYETVEGTGELASLQRAAAKALDENASQLARQGLRVILVPMPSIQQITRWDYFERVYSKAGRDQRVADLAKSTQIPVETVREKLKSTFVYVYRTFLNSVLLASNHSTREAPKRPAGTRRLLIVPRYAGVVSARMDKRAAAAYREAYCCEPEIVFVFSETLAYCNGSLRCFACGLPQGEPPTPP